MKYQLTITIANDGMPVFLIDDINGDMETVACDTHQELYDAMENLGINNQNMQITVY